MPTKDHEKTIRHLADLVQQIRPLAERVASDEFSFKERKKLRELAGIKEVIDLSYDLNLLVGETVRDMRLAGKTFLTMEELLELQSQHNHQGKQRAR